MSQRDLEILPFAPELAPYFKSINQQWIETMFTLEAMDIAMLEDPVAKVIAPGGQIWFARHPHHGVVGTCALLKQGEGIYELTKMGVTESARGLKVGEQLLQFVLARAGQIDMQCLFLLTNRRCEAAVHLYEKNGFEHCEEIMQRFGAAYERCNVAMRYIGVTPTRLS